MLDLVGFSWPLICETTTQDGTKTCYLSRHLERDRESHRLVVRLLLSFSLSRLFTLFLSIFHLPGIVFPSPLQPFLFSLRSRHLFRLYQDSKVAFTTFSLQLHSLKSILLGVKKSPF